MTWRDGYIAVDWGTTNRRAYLVAADGRVEDRLSDRRGLLSTPPDAFAREAAAMRERFGDRPMLLAGMVGSNRGWREAPYADAPAGAAELAASILWIEPGRTGIVPGVAQRGPGDADVMRGEEVQVIGAVAAGSIPADALMCHPGTHTKWILVDQGRIGRFRTMMTGEMFGLLKTHSILSEQMRGEVVDDASFRRGVGDGLGEASLLSRLFGIRARHVLGEDRDDAAGYASGLLIGSDVRAGLALHRGGPIALVGDPGLCALYGAALAVAGRETIVVDGAAAFLAGIRVLTEML
ncbi:2-dehydro-3-deoxygalactonokinase [Sphingosinicella ginsenosidimutans]|uniref:2-dehydro-3-deoxygalactonokinase n=1 Tax=Allosphingosinicella ginsenosidimutans TaxID=1176539 RepID=A0A5C6TV19_9SPHN|nr:2-dehydro-3-deoxygalactonokinase [Sphingosinicella ginsenosidimutans]TXC64187.1 2-dehydro-3-deoxygalactonokinase [Sphingosinicella ginsenosidimutans]